MYVLLTEMLLVFASASGVEYTKIFIPLSFFEDTLICFIMLQLVFFELDKSNVNNDMLEEMLDMLEV